MGLYFRIENPGLKKEIKTVDFYAEKPRKEVVAKLVNRNEDDQRDYQL